MSFLWTTGGGALLVDATLNSGSATLIMYEDTDGDGFADNTEEITLSGGSNDYEVPSFALGSGNAYWWRVTWDPQTTDNVSINKVELST